MIDERALASFSLFGAKQVALQTLSQGYRISASNRKRYHFR